MSTSTLPLLAITMGDPAGVGPEVIVKALAKPALFEQCRPVIVGDAAAMRKTVAELGKDLEVHVVSRPAEAEPRFGRLDVLDLHNVDMDALQMGKVSAMCGRAAVEAVFTAIDLAKAGEVEGIVTAPLNKEAMWEAGYHYPGHTEILAERTNTQRFGMMLSDGKMGIVHVTTHVSMRRALELVKQDRVAEVIRLADQGGRAMGHARPRVAVAGFNCHAGEGGLFGDEEIREITPAIEVTRAEGIDVTGPYPPDTVFLRAKQGQFDMCVAQYHDQGHIAMKLISFNTGVNVTLGLPFVRTSVDHGTAFGRAGQGRADEESMETAIAMGARMAVVRRKAA